MSKEHIRKIVDLPTIHLSGRDYVPPRTRDPEVRAFRHGRPAGTIMLEQQAAGLELIPRVLERAKTPEAVAFASTYLGAAAFNSSWYMQGREAPVMRRVARLPRLVDQEAEWRQTPEGLAALVRDNSQAVAMNAFHIAAEHARRKPNLRRLSVTGKGLAHLSLGLSTLPVAGIASTASEAEAQSHAWESAQDMVSVARTLGNDIGTNPSIAALADPDSDFSVFWRRTAPDDIYDALELTGTSTE